MSKLGLHAGLADPADVAEREQLSNEVNGTKGLKKDSYHVDRGTERPLARLDATVHAHAGGSGGGVEGAEGSGRRVNKRVRGYADAQVRPSTHGAGTFKRGIFKLPNRVVFHRNG